MSDFLKSYRESIKYQLLYIVLLHKLYSEKKVSVINEHIFLGENGKISVIFTQFLA